MVAVRTTHGTYTGESLEKIIHREYGPRAVAQQDGDINAPRWGAVIERISAEAYLIHALIYFVED